MGRVSGLMADLEHDRMTQANEVVRLSGVVADLEHDRMTQASEVVRLSGVVADLEHDRMTQASEVVRLSGVIADLERHNETQSAEVARLSAIISRHNVKHEVPRLPGSSETPIACDAGDASGLLRVVEAQASDLVRLRRALVSAQTVAAQRLELIHADANARQSQGNTEEGKACEWARSIVLGAIARI